MGGFENYPQVPKTPTGPRDQAQALVRWIAKSCLATTAEAEAGCEAAIRAAGEPLAEALRAMLWPGGVRPEGDDKSCHFPPPCEVCDAKAALAAWEDK
jgi:hypothetical protein